MLDFENEENPFEFKRNVYKTGNMWQNKR